MTSVAAPVSLRDWRPSPVFGGLVALTVALGFVLWRDDTFPTDVYGGDVALFAFVTCGWITTTALHEFAHAVVAYRGGDHTVADKGYLDLDFRRYTHPVYSLVLPVAFVALGGIALPGAAVWIQRSNLRGRWWDSGVSLAGPATNLVLGAVLLNVADLGLFAQRPRFAIALAFLGFLQIAATVLNMLPVPPLDGFGAIEPHLPRSLVHSLGPLRRWGLLLVFAVLWMNEPANDLFWDTIGWFVDAFGSDRALAETGWFRYRFWE